MDVNPFKCQFLWNQLPHDYMKVISVDSFKSMLKTHHFNEALNVQQWAYSSIVSHSYFISYVLSMILLFLCCNKFVFY